MLPHLVEVTEVLQSMFHESPYSYFSKPLEDLSIFSLKAG